MAQYAPTPTKPTRRKRAPIAIPPADAKKRPPQLPLYFPPDVEALLTPFRVKALQRIYEIAHQELGDCIVSTVVEVEYSYDEPGRTSLVLAVWANLDKGEWAPADRAIGDAVFEEEASWTENEIYDYLDMIHFEILPLITT